MGLLYHLLQPSERIQGIGGEQQTTVWALDLSYAANSGVTSVWSSADLSLLAYRIRPTTAITTKATNV